MTVYTAGWVAWFILITAGFFALEIPAVRRRGPGLDTLTDHIRWMFATTKKYKGTPFWALRRIFFLTCGLSIPAALLAHFMGWF